jgi:hypothetical protein
MTNIKTTKSSSGWPYEGSGDDTFGPLKDPQGIDLLSVSSPHAQPRRVQPAATMQIAGDHYKNFPIQPYEYCQLNKLLGLETNVIHYVTRHRLKGGKVDIEKAIHCLQLLLELEYAGK